MTPNRPLPDHASSLQQCCLAGGTRIDEWSKWLKLHPPKFLRVRYDSAPSYFAPESPFSSLIPLWGWMTSLGRLGTWPSDGVDDDTRFKTEFDQYFTLLTCCLEAKPEFDVLCSPAIANEWSRCHLPDATAAAISMKTLCRSKRLHD